MAAEPWSTPSEHWKLYNTNLLAFYCSSGGNFDSKTQVFYTVPVGTIIIPVGANITEAQTNCAIYKTADTLLDVKSPVCVLGAGGYFDCQSRHLHAVQLPENGKMGAKTRLKDAQRRRDDLQDLVTRTRSKASAAYEFDKKERGSNQGFKDWAFRNYPMYISMKSDLQEVEAALSAANIEVYGPGAVDLDRRISRLKQAQDEDEAHRDLNMEVKPDPKAGISTTRLPLYSMVGDYPGTAKQWSSQNPSLMDSLEMDLLFTPPSDETWWKNAGFPDGVDIPDSYSLFWTKPDQTNNEIHRSARELKDAVSVELRIRGIKAFDIKAGSWDGDFATLYDSKLLKSDFKLDAACAVSTVIMAYGATYEVTLGPSAAKQIQQDFSSAKQGGGTFSLLGTPIAVPGSKQEPAPSYKLSQKDEDDFTKFTASRDPRGHPMVLGVIGRRLPQIG